MVVGSSARVMQVGAELQSRGFIVGAVRPPTVPPGTSRLRNASSAAHTEEQVDALAGHLTQILAIPALSDGDVIERLDRAHVWHPYTQHGSSRAPVEIKRASGAFLYDQNDRAIFDGISSWWVTLHGHAQPEIARAIAEQAGILEQVIFSGISRTSRRRRSARELLAVLPGNRSRCFFRTMARPQSEVALKIAIQYWVNAGEKRPLVAALENAYHGDTFGAMSVGAGVVCSPRPFQDRLFEVVRLPDPSSGDLLAAINQLIVDRGSELAAIIVEPLLLGAGGMRVYGEELLRDMRERVHQVGRTLHCR